MDSTYLNLEALLKDVGNSMPVIATTTTSQKQTPKKRFMLVGTHAHQMTGYSKVTYHILQELAKLGQFELFHFGFQKAQGTPPEYRPYPAGVDVHDAVAAEANKTAPSESGFGFSQLPDYVRKVKPDAIMIYNDASIVCRFLEVLTEKLSEEERAAYKMIVYLDQVYITQRPEFLARIDKDTHTYFAFTEYWKTILQEQGIKKPIHVLRHGFDPDLFKQMDRTAVRKKHGMPENAFIMLNLNRNTPRKRHDIVVQAFAQLVARHPTKPLGLLCVCDGGEMGGFPLREIYVRELLRLRIPVEHHLSKLMLTTHSMAYTDEIVNELYALSDIGITAAEGEGFGLCQFEAMGVGIPQVVPYIGGFRDFCKHGVNSMAVDAKMTLYLPLGSSGIGGAGEYVYPQDLMLAAEEYLMDSELREKHGLVARETVLSYKWSTEVAELAKVLRGL